MKMLTTFFFMSLSVPLTAMACPTGMVYNGNGCSPPYEYTGWDWLRDQYDAIESIGADRPRTYSRGLSREELADLEHRSLEAKQEKERKLEKLAKGLWHVDSTSTPEGKMCAATFAKYTTGKDGVEGGLVTIMGFQKPKPDAWLIFHGTKLPMPKNVKKLKISLQQDDEPAQMVQVFNYRESMYLGTVAFAVPNLTAALEGMRDTQTFKLSLDGKALLSIQWAEGAPVIEQLKQCAI